MTISYLDVLDFWFDELTPKDWFTGGEHIDALIKERFSDLHQAATQGSCLNGAKRHKGA